ncbi:hypothetical protein Zm00014a_014642 [Zea mays]|jgi:hypothetical protein|nr:hypothetical protein ZEAMMB73_Zm00001d001839 [Zea mays]PWZ39296.1 hypothetical protein Zm00014a_014642 [Zea mays]
MPPTTALAAKVALASAALAAFASLARLAVPRLVAVAAAVLPRAWAAARLWLVPPYLFVTVHLIILVIWKLSDHRHSQQQAAAAQHKDDPWPPAAELPSTAAAATPAVRAKEEQYGQPLPAEFSSPSPDSGGGGSCVTTESDEDASSPSPDVLWRSLAPAPQERAVVLEREPSLPPSQAVDGDDDDDDLDATWNAIMQKTRPAAPAATPPAPAPAPAAHHQQRPPPRARDPSVGAEEMNRRFDDFIKKNRNSFGRQ